MLLFAVAVGYWFWPRSDRQAPRAVAVPRPSPLSASASRQTTPSSPQPKLQQARGQLADLQSELDQLNRKDLHFARLTRGLREIALRIQDLQNRIAQERNGRDQNRNLERLYRQNNQYNRNDALIALEADIQNIDAQIAQLQSQVDVRTPAAVPALPLVPAPPPVPATNLLPRLQARRSQLLAQIRIVQLNAQNASLQLSQEAEAANAESQALENSLQRQLAQAQGEARRWETQIEALGQESQRHERMETLRRQIDAQKTEIQRLENLK